MKTGVIIFIFLFLGISTITNAGEFYAEIGLGMRIGGTHETEHSEIGYRNPLGSLEIGYCGIVVKEICSSIQHISSLSDKTDNNKGLQPLWLKYRKTW